MQLKYCTKESFIIMMLSVNATYMLKETFLLKALYPQVVADPVTSSAEL